MENEIKLTLAVETFAKCYGILILENGDYMIEIDQDFFCFVAKKALIVAS